MTIEKYWNEEERFLIENDKRITERQEKTKDVVLRLIEGHESDFDYIYNIYLQSTDIFVAELLGDILFELDSERCEVIEDDRYFN